MTNAKPTTIPLFPLLNGLFPDSILRLNIFEVRYLDLIKKCEQNKLPFGVVFIEDGTEVQAAGKTPSFFPTGTLADLQVVNRVQASLFQVQCQGGQRFEMKSYELGAYGVWYAEVEYLDPDPEVFIPSELQAVADRLGQIIAQAQQIERDEGLPFGPPYRLDECGWVANRVAELLPIATSEKHALLVQKDPLVRLQTIFGKIQF